MYTGTKRSISYLIKKEITRDIINNSEIINLFLNEKSEYLDIKKEMKSALAMIELSQELKKKSTVKAICK